MATRTAEGKEKGPARMERAPECIGELPQVGQSLPNFQQSSGVPVQMAAMSS